MHLTRTAVMAVDVAGPAPLPLQDPLWRRASRVGAVGGLGIAEGCVQVVTHFLDCFNHGQKSRAGNTKAAKGQDGHHMCDAIEAPFGVIGDDNSSSSECPNEVVGQMLIHADLYCPHAFATPKIVPGQGVGPLSVPRGSVTNLLVIHVVVTFQTQDGPHLVSLVVSGPLQQLNIHTKFSSPKRVGVGVGQ